MNWNNRETVYRFNAGPLLCVLKGQTGTEQQNAIPFSALKTAFPPHEVIS